MKLGLNGYTNTVKIGMLLRTLLLLTISFGALAQGTETSIVSLPSKPDTSFVVNYAEGQDAKAELEELDRLAKLGNSHLSQISDGLELRSILVDKSELVERGNSPVPMGEVYQEVLNQPKLLPQKSKSMLRKALEFEYYGKTKKTVGMRSLTFAVNSGLSIYIWNISGIGDTSSFLAISYSMLVSGIFIFFEDNADKKWYRTEGMLKFARKTLELSKKAGIFFKKGDPINQEQFLQRFFSTALIDLLLVTGYEMIVKYPDLMNPENLLEIFLKLGVGMVIGYGYSFTRSYLKDIVAEGKLGQRTVDIYSFGSKVFTASAYFSLYSGLVGKLDLVLYVGLPGWGLAYLLHPKTRSQLGAFWDVFYANFLAKYRSMQFSWEVFRKSEIEEIYFGAEAKNRDIPWSLPVKRSSHNVDAPSVLCKSSFEP